MGKLLVKLVQSLAGYAVMLSGFATAVTQLKTGSATTSLPLGSSSSSSSSSSLTVIILRRLGKWSLIAFPVFHVTLTGIQLWQASRLLSPLKTGEERKNDAEEEEPQYDPQYPTAMEVLGEASVRRDLSQAVREVNAIELSEPYHLVTIDADVSFHTPSSRGDAMNTATPTATEHHVAFLRRKNYIVVAFPSICISGTNCREVRVGQASGAAVGVWVDEGLLSVAEECHQGLVKYLTPHVLPSTGRGGVVNAVGKKIIFTGHGDGGALAHVAAMLFTDAFVAGKLISPQNSSNQISVISMGPSKPWGTEFSSRLVDSMLQPRNSLRLVGADVTTGADDATTSPPTAESRLLAVLLTAFPLLQLPLVVFPALRWTSAIPASVKKHNFGRSHNGGKLRMFGNFDRLVLGQQSSVNDIDETAAGDASGRVIFSEFLTKSSNVTRTEYCRLLDVLSEEAVNQGNSCEAVSYGWWSGNA